MAAQHLTRREFEDWRDRLTGFFETSLDQTVRASERRIIKETRQMVEESRKETKAEIQELRTEVKAEIQGVRAELLAEIKDAREEYRAEIKWLKREYLDQRDRLDRLTDAVYLILNHLGVEPPPR